MTEKEIDIMWNRALCDAVAANEPYTRYKFAASVEARVREACADAVRFADNGTEAAEIIRARGNT